MDLIMPSNALLGAGRLMMIISAEMGRDLVPRQRQNKGIRESVFLGIF